MGMEQLLDASSEDAVVYRPRDQATALCIFPYWVDVGAMVAAVREHERSKHSLFEVIDDQRAGFGRLVITFSEIPSGAIWYTLLERLRSTAQVQGAASGKKFRHGGHFGIDWAEDISG